MRNTDRPLPKLLDGEKITDVKNFSEHIPKKRPSTVLELERLAQVSKEGQIGDSGPVHAAGPLSSHLSEPAFNLYKVTYGRDSLRVALDLLSRYPKLARVTLINLASSQGVSDNKQREEEPGRIIHEDRDLSVDSIAQQLSRERGWGWPYYGSVDSTPEFIRTLTAYIKRSPEGAKFLNITYKGRNNEVHTMAYALEAAVGWILNRLSANREGLLEFHKATPGGLENQAWKDSWDAYFHQDGTIANHKKGIASIEVQRVAYDALIDAAELYEKYLNNPQVAKTLKARAENLKALVINRFWTEDKGGYFVLGTDRNSAGNLRQLAIRTSNMGHLLHSRLLQGDGEKLAHFRDKIVNSLFSQEMLGINGIMTLASDEVRYRPGSYHNGSVWAWDNYIIAQGLELHGYFGLRDYIEQVLMEGINYTHRFVECMRGGYDPDWRVNSRIVDVYDSVNERPNRLEQPPQDMQAWTAAAVLAIKIDRAKRKLTRLSPNQRQRDLEKKLLSRFST